MQPHDLTKRIGVIALGVVFVAVIGPSAGASDESTAKKLVITEADVGSGFVAQTPPDVPDVLPQIAECVGKSIEGRKLVASERGPKLSNQTEQGLQIDSSVDIVKTKAMAEAYKAVVSSAKYPGCVAQGPKDSHLTSPVDVQRARVKKYGDYSTAVIVRVDNSEPVAKFTIYGVEIQKGRALLRASFVINGTTPYDRAAAEKIIDNVAKRLDKAKV